jgi:hypothetical protein
MSNEKKQNSERRKNNYSLNFFNKAIRKIKGTTQKENTFTLTDFPYEILLMICSYLPPKDLITCGIVCKTLNNVNNDSVFEERLKLFKQRLNLSKRWQNIPSSFMLQCLIPNLGINCELLHAYLQNIPFQRTEVSTCIGTKVTDKSISYNERIIITRFWDIHYSEILSGLYQSFMGRSNSTFIIVNMNQPNSGSPSLNLEKAQGWLDTIKIINRHLFIAFIGHYDPEKLLQISDEDLVLFSEKNNIHFSRTIDRTNMEEVNNLFNTLLIEAAEHFVSQDLYTKPEKSKSTCQVM